MPKPVQCKIIGGISVLLGIGVLVASSVYLHESSHEKCKSFYLSIPSSIQHRSPTGGVHGVRPRRQVYIAVPERKRQVEGGYAQAAADSTNWHDHGDGDYHSNYDAHGQGRPVPQPGSGFPHGGQGYGTVDSGYGHDYSDFLTHEKCTEIIKKYRACAIIAIVASILQILISAVYAFATKKTVKTLSLGWIGTHSAIIIALIATAAVVLAEKRLDLERKGVASSSYQNDDTLPEKKLGFAILALLDAFFLILMIVFACLTWKKSDYDDYPIEPKERPARKKFLES